MAGVARKTRKPPQVDEAARIEQMEKAGPRADQLRQLVKKFPAPLQWYDEVKPIRKPKRRR